MFFKLPFTVSFIDLYMFIQIHIYNVCNEMWCNTAERDVVKYC